MIFPQTKLNVVDNSGVKKILCVHVYSKKYNKCGKVSNYILGVVLSLTKKIKKKTYVRGELVKAVVINSVKNVQAGTGINYSFFSNNCLLVDKKKILMGTRVFTPSLFIASQYSKIYTKYIILFLYEITI